MRRSSLSLVTRPLELIRRFDKHHKPGAAPGSLNYVGSSDTSRPINLSVLEYTSEGYDETRSLQEKDLNPLFQNGKYSWINIDGIHDTTLVAAVCKDLGVHPLVREDIVQVGHRPKFEVFPEFFYMVLQTPSLSPEGVLSVEQISIVGGADWLLTFQENEHDVFAPIHGRIKRQTGQLHKQGIDYLAYALLDTVVDHITLAHDQLDALITGVEDKVYKQIQADTIITEISFLKRQTRMLLSLSRTLREVITSMSVPDNSFIRERTQLYLGDVRDHVLINQESADQELERLQDLTSLYMAQVSNKMNEVMKTLTIVGGIFIPLTFVAGIYGMNFNHMPELNHPNGYPMVLGVMGLVALGLLGFFKYRRWF